VGVAIRAVRAQHAEGKAGRHRARVCAIDHRFTKSGRLRSARLAEGGELGGEWFISDLDPAWLYHALLPGRRRWTARRLARLHFSPGLFVLYFGSRRPYPQLGRHTIQFGRRFRGALDELFHHGQLPPDFSLYLHRATAHDPGMAPPGCDSFYALLVVPNLRTPLDWQEQGPRLAEAVVTRLEQTLLPGLRDRTSVV
jgi:phytoene desaturase